MAASFVGWFVLVFGKKITLLVIVSQHCFHGSVSTSLPTSSYLRVSRDVVTLDFLENPPHLTLNSQATENARTIHCMETSGC